MGDTPADGAGSQPAEPSWAKDLSPIDRLLLGKDYLAAEAQREALHDGVDKVEAELTEHLRDVPPSLDPNFIPPGAGWPPELSRPSRTPEMRKLLNPTNSSRRRTVKRSWLRWLLAGAVAAATAITLLGLILGGVFSSDSPTTEPPVSAPAGVPAGIAAPPSSGVQDLPLACLIGTWRMTSFESTESEARGVGLGGTLLMISDDRIQTVDWNSSQPVRWTGRLVNPIEEIRGRASGPLPGEPAGEISRTIVDSNGKSYTERLTAWSEGAIMPLMSVRCTDTKLVARSVTVNAPQQVTETYVRTSTAQRL
jgi:hypothetical protein